MTWPQALGVSSKVIGLKDGAIILDAPSAELEASDLADIYGISDSSLNPSRQ